jgi:hypothetical protein
MVPVAIDIARTPSPTSSPFQSKQEGLVLIYRDLRSSTPELWRVFKMNDMMIDMDTSQYEKYSVVVRTFMESLSKCKFEDMKSTSILLRLAIFLMFHYRWHPGFCGYIVSQ